MSLRISFSTIVGILIYTVSYAQTAVTYQYNGYRDGDKLYRIAADYAYIGNGGENCVWELPSAQKDDCCFELSVHLRNDSLTITEGDMMFHYIANEKELSMRGYQNRGISNIYGNQIKELEFPFTYGDSIADDYSCQTSYYDMRNLDGEGKCYTVCDGMGILTDGHETLENVLRIRHHNTLVSRYEGADGDTIESETSEDKYLWYYPGCRYPVMDTRIVSSKENGRPVFNTTFTSLYLPELQLADLRYDDDNMQLIAKRKNSNPADDHKAWGEEEVTFPIKMRASLQPESNEIALDYQTTEDTKASFYAYDLSGKLLGYTVHTSLKKGGYHDTMALANRPMNNVVMLTMIANGMQHAVKVR